MSPYYTNPVFVDANVTRGRGHVMADKLVILHVVLSSLANVPSPVGFIQDLMYTFLGDALLCEKIVFDLQGDGSNKHKRTMERLLQHLKRYNISI